MKSTGIVRKLDSLGRVVFPIELRRELGWKEKDPIEIYVDGDFIILKKHISQGACAVTGEVLKENRVVAGLTLSPAAIERMKKELATQ